MSDTGNMAVDRWTHSRITIVIKEHFKLMCCRAWRPNSKSVKNILNFDAMESLISSRDLMIAQTLTVNIDPECEIFL